MNEAPRPAVDDEITLTDIWIKLQEWWSYIWKRKTWIVGIAFLFAVGGYVKAKLEKPSYSATLTFALEQGSKGGGLTCGSARRGFWVLPFYLLLEDM